MQLAQGQIRPLRDQVIVRDMSFAERRTSAGVILLADNGERRGIRARWAQIFAVGPERTDLQPGQWILLEHGRWTRGVHLTTPDGEQVLISRVDNQAILAVSDQQPADFTVNGDV